MQAQSNYAIKAPERSIQFQIHGDIPMKKFLTLLSVCVFSLLVVQIASPANAGDVRRILKNEWGWSPSVIMRNAPTIDGEEIRLINWFLWPGTTPNAVELTGKIENEWVEILHPTKDECDKHGKSHCPQAQGWILGEFVGVLPENTEYVAFQQSKEYRVTHHRVLGRLLHSIFANEHTHHWNRDNVVNSRRCCGAYTFNKGDSITVIGKKGNWLQVTAINGKPHSEIWTFEQLAELIEPVN